MDAKRLADLARFSDDKLQKLPVFQTGRLWLDVYCVKPGQSQRPHTHVGSDKVYCVLEGRCAFRIGGERAEHGPGTAVLAPAGVEHGVENIGDTDARLLVVMSPPPEHG